MRQKLIDTYLDYVNNFIRLSAVADHYGIDPVDMDQLICIGRKLHNANVAHLKACEANRIERLKS